jgi:hypothetical protein
VDLFESPNLMTPEQRLGAVAAILAAGMARARAAELANPASGKSDSGNLAAQPLDSAGETRLSGHTVYRAERPHTKRADEMERAPRRLSPQRPSKERDRHG